MKEFNAKLGDFGLAEFYESFLKIKIQNRKNMKTSLCSQQLMLCTYNPQTVVAHKIKIYFCKS
uniref:Uncharacterized protein n=1 Tax=Rhizophora mucronata TaxID=61149 RepID=A0A2P2PQH8_RHIMU